MSKDSIDVKEKRQFGRVICSKRGIVGIEPYLNQRSTRLGVHVTAPVDIRFGQPRKIGDGEGYTVRC